MLPLDVLAQFLRDMANKIEQKTASEGELQLATEHFIATHFQTAAPLPEELAKKYLALGWYIYTSGGGTGGGSGGGSGETFDL